MRNIFIDFLASGLEQWQNIRALFRKIFRK